MSVSLTLKNRIQNIIALKQTNVVLSADVTTSTLVLELIKKVATKIIGVKLHMDIYTDLDTDQSIYCFVTSLKELAVSYNFIIIEDRKLCDIGNTVALQSKNIVWYADLITVHSLPGAGILNGIRQNCEKYKCGVLLIAQMSSQDNLFSDVYTTKTIDLALNYSDIVVGFIAQEKLADNFLHFSPGVNICKSSDTLGQGYNTPQFLVHEKSIDVLIVGRGIYESPDPCNTVNNYICLKSNITELHRNSLISQLLDLNVVKIATPGNEYQLKSGEKTNTYLDCRLLMKNVHFMKDIAVEMFKLIPPDLHREIIIAGVPMGGLPLSTMVAFAGDLPMILVRSVQKEYGLKKQIEGCDDISTKRCIVIEDVLTSGDSILETIDILKQNAYSIEYVIGIVDREAGAIERLNGLGYRTKTLFTISELRKKALERAANN